MRTAIRKLRHWKQRWNKHAEFVWRRPTVYLGVLHQPGDPVPEVLQQNPTKLRRFWESQRIELAEFEAPNVTTGRVAGAEQDDLPDLPDGVVVTRNRNQGSWFTVAVEGHAEVKVNGRRALTEFIESLLEESVEERESLTGSNLLESTYEIFGERVPLGEIVCLAFGYSTLTPAEWNALEDVDREGRLAVALSWMQDTGAEDWLDGGNGDQ